MNQGSELWHEWRRQGLGASDAPVIMGVSPWMTPFQLWEEKLGKTRREQSSFITDKGNRLEPKARALYELETGLELPPTLAMNKDFPFIRSSLDGYSEEAKVILEIKYTGKADHEGALRGEVPDKYYPQLQHQLLACPSAGVVHYLSFDGENIAVVEVYPNVTYQLELFEALCRFWKHVEEGTPPDLTDRDYRQVESPELEALLAEYDHINSQVKRLEEVKKRIFEHSDLVHARVHVGDWKIKLHYRKGVPYRTISKM